MSQILHVLADGRLMFFCPGCRCGHAVIEPKWTWNKSLDAPTFTPSILVTGHVEAQDNRCWPSWKPGSGPSVEIRCHSYVTGGQIKFLADCSHELAGKTVPLEPF